MKLPESGMAGEAHWETLFDPRLGLALDELIGNGDVVETGHE